MWRFGFSYDQLFLIGFSQGAMMANYQGLFSEKTPKGIISFSGKVILPEMLGETSLSKPKICLIHGRDDSVVPIENFEITDKEKYKRHNILEHVSLNYIFDISSFLSV